MQQKWGFFCPYKPREPLADTGWFTNEGSKALPPYNNGPHGIIHFVGPRKWQRPLPSGGVHRWSKLWLFDRKTISNDEQVFRTNTGLGTALLGFYLLFYMLDQSRTFINNILNTTQSLYILLIYYVFLYFILFYILVPTFFFHHACSIISVIFETKLYYLHLTIFYIKK